MAREAEREAAMRGERKDLYFSVDVETSGLVPMYHSMYSFGVVAIRDGEIVDTFEHNLEPLNPFVRDNDNIRFWKEHQAAWEAHRRFPILKPNVAFNELHEWVRYTTQSDEVPVFVAYPAAFDFGWMEQYGDRFSPDNYPFGHSAFCMQSMAATILNVPFSQAREKNWPEAWRKEMSHTHIALNDALDQARVFILMQKELPLHRRGVFAANRGVAIGGNITGSVINIGDELGGKSDV